MSSQARNIQYRRKCHVKDVVVLSQIDSWKFAQQKLQKVIHIAKKCRSQQVNETIEGLIIVLKMNIYSFSVADQYIVLHNSEFIRRSHS